MATTIVKTPRSNTEDSTIASSRGGQDDEEVDDAHDDPAEQSREVTGGQTHDGADDHRHDGRGDADEDRDAGSPEDAHPHLPAEVVGAQRVVETRRSVAVNVELLRDVEHRRRCDERGGDRNDDEEEEHDGADECGDVGAEERPVLLRVVQPAFAYELRTVDG
jgi:hypothetical protein